MKKYFDTIKELLIKNGFNEVKEYKYSNELCTVEINDIDNPYYSVTDEEGTMYSSNFEIYWLVGVLVYKGYIKNFQNL